MLVQGGGGVCDSERRGRIIGGGVVDLKSMWEGGGVVDANCYCKGGCMLDTSKEDKI